MVEIRSYHFAKDRLEEYRRWARDVAVPHLKTRMDLVGFWIDNGMPPIVGGSLPREPDSRIANVTWVIRWQDKAQRDRVWEELRAGSEWRAILAQVPGGEASYLVAEARFADEL